MFLKVFIKHTKNNHPREGKKVVFLRFLARNTWFPHENNAIAHCFFPWGLVSQAWAHFECFLGSPGRPSGATGHPLKPQLGHFADSWCPGRPLGSLLGPIWCSVGWLCALLGAMWRKSGYQLDDFVSLGVKFGFFCVSGLWMTLFYDLSGPLAEFVHIGSAGLDLGWITFFMVEYCLLHS